MVFDRLGVIAGPFDIDDAVALCADVVTEFDVITSLASLVDKSLVQRLASSPPFHLLESLREFSLEQLVAAGADQSVHRRHAERFRDLAASLRRTCLGPREPAIFDLITAQVNDFEAATRWAAANGELDWALSIVVDLNTIGFQRGWRPAATWLADLLRAPPDPLPDAWADFLAASSATALNELGAVGRGRELAGAALSADPDNPQALIVLAHLARHPNECYENARRQHEAAAERAQLQWELNAATYQGFGAVVDGNTAEALDVAREIRLRGDELADRSTIGWSALRGRAGPVVDRSGARTRGARRGASGRRRGGQPEPRDQLPAPTRVGADHGRGSGGGRGRDPLVARSHTRAR